MKQPFQHLREQPLSIALATIIWILCMWPSEDFPTVEFTWADKWVHFVMYGALSLTIAFEYHRRHKQTQWTHFTIGAILLPIFMGGLVELAQANLTTNRSGDWYDFLANSIGVLIGILLSLPLLLNSH